MIKNGRNVIVFTILFDVIVVRFCVSSDGLSIIILRDALWSRITKNPEVVLGHSLLHLLICSHGSLICLLR